MEKARESYERLRRELSDEKDSAWELHWLIPSSPFLVNTWRAYDSPFTKPNLIWGGNLGPWVGGIPWLDSDRLTLATFASCMKNTAGRERVSALWLKMPSFVPGIEPFPRRVEAASVDFADVALAQEHCFHRVSRVLPFQSPLSPLHRYC